jgi:exosortase A
MSLSTPHPGDLAPGTRAAPWRRWLVPAACIVVAMAALVALFPVETQGAWRVWTGSTAFSHCFLVVPLALYMIWDRRESLREVAPRSAFSALPLLPILSAGWLLAAVLGVLELQQFLLVTMIEGILLVILGTAVFRRLLGPLLFLYLLVPTGEFLVPGLQSWTARFVVASLHLVGVPVYSDGILIQIPEGDFMVAEACAGLRFLIASVAFGIFFALVVYRGWGRRLAFIAISLVVPVVANGIRAFGIVYLAHLTNDVVAVEADHIIYGWGFFAAVMLVLIAIGLRFADHPRPTPAAPAATPPAARPELVIGATVLVLVGVALGPAYAAFLEAPGVRTDLAGEPMPAVAPPWRPTATADDPWQPILVAPDLARQDTWSADGASVERFIALYAVAGRHNNLVRGQNRIADEKHWVRAEGGQTHTVIGGHEVVLNSAILAQGTRRRLVWYAYIVDGQVTASALAAKLRQARAILTGGGGTSAFLALSADASTDGASAAKTLDAFARAMALPETGRP